MPNDDYFTLLAMEQLQQDIDDGDWSAIYELLQQLPDNTLMQYVTFEEPSYD
jgi:hypothetical protein